MPDDNWNPDAPPLNPDFKDAAADPTITPPDVTLEEASNPTIAPPDVTLEEASNPATTPDITLEPHDPAEGISTEAEREKLEKERAKPPVLELIHTPQGPVTRIVGEQTRAKNFRRETYLKRRLEGTSQKLHEDFDRSR